MSLFHTFKTDNASKRYKQNGNRNVVTIAVVEIRIFHIAGFL